MSRIAALLIATLSLIAHAQDPNTTPSTEKVDVTNYGVLGALKENPIPESTPITFWHGWMVVDVENHQVAFLPWNGEGTFNREGAIAVKGTAMGEKGYMFPIPREIPSFMEAVLIQDGQVYVMTSVEVPGTELVPGGTRERCTMLGQADAFNGGPAGYNLVAAGVSGQLYHGHININSLVIPMGNCTDLVEEPPPNNK